MEHDCHANSVTYIIVLIFELISWDIQLDTGSGHEICVLIL